MSDVYDDAMKALAARPAQRLAEAMASARLDNPLCGDTVTVDVRVEAGVVRELGHAVKGCLLCRAASAVAMEAIPALEIEAAAALAESVPFWLKQGGAPPLPGLAVFSPVSAHKSRHSCVSLPFKALAKALEAK